MRFTLYEIFIVLALVVSLGLAISMPLGAWDDPVESAAALKKAGFGKVEVGEDHKLFKCGTSDVSALAFTANNPVGNRVSGIVCCGWWKGCTIRF
jgi:hypothetical protein